MQKVFVQGRFLFKKVLFAEKKYFRIETSSDTSIINQIFN